MKFFNTRKEKERLARLARLEEEKQRKSERTNKIMNGIGSFLILVGLLSLPTNGFLTGLFIALFGFTLTTFFDLILGSFTNSSNKVLKYLISFALFFCIGIFSPSTETDNNQTLDSTNIDEIVETNYPTATPAELPVETTAPKPTVKPTIKPTIEPTKVPENIATTNTAVEKGTTQASLWADACDLNGYREPNAVVDIGFGDREYWAYTNEYGQLVKVIAKEIILQNDNEANSNGRYCSDEAKVPGTEDKELDEGHVIADSLGGVSNAYNITPQNSTLNRHGDQAYMEKTIRDAGGATDFVAEITYPNTETQIPSHYKYTYTVWGNVVVDEFDNVNPETTVPQHNSSNGSSNSNKSENTYVEPQAPVVQEPVVEEPVYSAPQTDMVWLSASGSKYHSINNCGRMNPNKARQITLAEAEASGFERCSKCW